VAALHRRRPGERTEALRAQGVEVIEVAADAHGRVDIKAARASSAAAGSPGAVEGGGEVAAALSWAGLIDRVTSYQAGLFLGADSRLRLDRWGWKISVSRPGSPWFPAGSLGGDVVETWHRGGISSSHVHRDRHRRRRDHLLTPGEQQGDRRFVVRTKHDMARCRWAPRSPARAAA
jgi:hypothetical protein